MTALISPGIDWRSALIEYRATSMLAAASGLILKAVLVRCTARRTWIDSWLISAIMLILCLIEGVLAVPLVGVSWELAFRALRGPTFQHPFGVATGVGMVLLVAFLNSLGDLLVLRFAFNLRRPAFLLLYLANLTTTAVPVYCKFVSGPVI